MCEIEDKLKRAYKEALILEKMNSEVCSFVTNCWFAQRMSLLDEEGSLRCPREDQSICPRRRDQLRVDNYLNPLEPQSGSIVSPVPYRSEIDLLFPEQDGENHNGRKPHRSGVIPGCHL